MVSLPPHTYYGVISSLGTGEHIALSIRARHVEFTIMTREIITMFVRRHFKRARYPKEKSFLRVIVTETTTTNGYPQRGDMEAP